MKRLLCAASVALLLAACGPKAGPVGSSHEPAADQPAAAAAKYHCPMHPSYVSDRPGLCPICNMSLVPIEAGAAAGSSNVAGRTAIMIQPERRRQIGLATTVVTRKELTRSIHATGTITYDEGRRSRIAPRVGGWVRDLKVSATGQAVKKGDPLFTLYSPDLLVAQREYLDAKSAGDPAMLQASRRRLDLWEIPAAEIEELERSGKARDTLVLAAPADGVVTMKGIVAGQAIMPGETVYEMADLSRLWVQAAVYEQDLPLVHTGLVAQVEVAGFDNKSFAAEVTFIAPAVDPATRTVAVRLELDNAEGLLRPDLWAGVDFAIRAGEGPVIPASAVIDTGRRLVAFVDRKDGALEPRVVRVLARGEDELLVRDGVAEGERVVTRALFLVDAESQLKAVISGMSE